MWRVIGIGAGVGLGVVGLVAVLLLVFSDRLGEWAVTKHVLPELEARLGKELRVGAVEAGMGVVTLKDLEVRGEKGSKPLATAARMDVHFALSSALRGSPEIEALSLAEPETELERTAAGGDETYELVAELAEGVVGEGDGDAASPGGAGALGGLSLGTVSVTGGRLRLSDEETGVVISARDVGAELDWENGAELTVGYIDVVARAGPTASAEEVRITGAADDLLGTAEVSLSEGRISLGGGLELTDIRGELGTRGAPGELDIKLEGSYGGAAEPLWSAEGWFDAARGEGELAVDAERFTLDRVAHVIGDAPIRNPSETALGASLRLELGPQRASFRGDVAVEGLTVAHPMLAAEPLEGIEASARVGGELDRVTRALSVDDAAVEVGGVEYELEGFVWLPGGVNPIETRVRRRPRAGARLAVSPVGCDEVLASIPAALVPELRDFELGGEFTAELSVDVDLEHARATVLEGEVGIGGCRVKSAPPQMHAARLWRQFSYDAQLTESDARRVVVGPDNPSFVPIDEVSEHLVNALMTTEDSNFYGHDGYVRSQFREALIRNLEAGYFRYGASSITMQMVKNVLLGHEKTLARKLQELFLTWHVETELSKDRIMEIYVNAIEFGPGIYGIGEAAEHYFGKHASELNPVEAAFFSAILPNPRGRYGQFCRGELNRGTEAMIELFVDIMHERDRLTDIEHQIAKNTPLFFDRSNVDSVQRCVQRARRALDSIPAAAPTLDDADELATR